MSMAYLCEAFLKGIGTSIDMQEAHAWADRVSRKGLPLAMMAVAIFYFNAKNYSEARPLLERVLETDAYRDDTQAHHVYAKICLAMRGPGDLQRARGSLEKAASLGHLRAKRRLSQLLISGRFGIMGVPRGVRMALSLLGDFRGIAYQSDGTKADIIRLINEKTRN